jgi:hypothetical protein
MNSKICCWRVVSFGSAIRVLCLARTCVRNSKGPVGRQQVFVHEKSRRSGFLRVCAREDSNLHPAIAGPGPQPGASTNSATGASGNASLAADPATNLPRRPRARLPLGCWSDSRERGEKSAPEESPDTVGRGWSRQPDPGKPAGKCHRKEPPKRRDCSSISSPARVKRCGKSAPASRRRGGRANPTRCKAKQGR